MPARLDDRDGVFPDGWQRGAEDAVAQPRRARERAEELGPSALSAFDRQLAMDVERASLIEERARAGPLTSIPDTLSVSSLIDYVRCPKLFYWSVVRPLPRRPSPSARLGTEIHRWIELESRGQATLGDFEQTPDLSTEERLSHQVPAAALKQAFRESRFADRVPLFAERGFLLYLDGFVVGGRIDAIFGTPEGPWEVVDYKTGRRPAEDDPVSGLQLDLYALACAEVWHKRPEDLTLTYFYLASGEEVSTKARDPQATRARVQRALRGIAAGNFETAPGFQCRWCDFQPFCEAGRVHVAGSG